MSFILDALKKSETDRQRQSGPSLFEVKIAPPRRALPVWAVAIGVLLGINIIVVSWMLLRHPAAQPLASASTALAAAPQVAHATATSGGAVGQAVQAPGAADATSNARSSAGAAGPPAATAGTGAPSPVALGGPTASTRTAVPAAGPTASTVATGSAGTATPAASSAAERAAGLNRSPAAASAASDADPDNAQATASDQSDFEPADQPAAGAATSTEAAGDLPLYQQIVSSAGLPELHLDLHVFADRPEDRFVMINMHRLGEGASLPNGVHVEAIRPDGVVLSYHGTRFLLPRN